MNSDKKICAFIQAYCLIPEGAQVRLPITVWLSIGSTDSYLTAPANRHVCEAS